MQARVLQQEMGRAGAFNPFLGEGMGVTIRRSPNPPGLRHRGAEQAPHPADLLRRGALVHRLGSEPNAGSDLAALQRPRVRTRRRSLLINGSKIWTSGAQWSQWCGALVRTDTSVKHDGISFLLIPMDQPGVETRPIKLIAGASPFCETFTDAQAAKDYMLGEINKRWTWSASASPAARARQQTTPRPRRGPAGAPGGDRPSAMSAWTPRAGSTMSTRATG